MYTKWIKRKWDEYRRELITNLVNHLADTIHRLGKKATVDVYPGINIYVFY